MRLDLDLHSLFISRSRLVSFSLPEVVSNTMEPGVCRLGLLGVLCWNGCLLLRVSLFLLDGAKVLNGPRDTTVGDRRTMC